MYKLLLIAFLGSFGLSSALFTPATVNDLINDINTANTNDENDTINLGTGSPFILTIINNDVNGLPVILSDNNHTLLIENGIIERNSSDFFRIIEIGDGAQLSLNNITLQNGNPGSGNPGGAIYIDANGALSSVTNGTFVDNTADTGGVISSDGSIGAISNCTFNANTALGGGAIAVNGSLGSISFSAFTSNSANNGGAIFMFANSNIGSIADTVFANNTTTGIGGALSVAGGQVTSIIGSVFSRNAATSGGAIAITDGTGPQPGYVGIIQYSLFLNNVAPIAYGGAIYAATNLTTVPNVLGTISATRFIDNQGFLGGAIALVGIGFTSIDRSTFDSNSGLVTGGALFSGSSQIGTIENSTFSNNQTTGTNSDGGAISLQSEAVYPSPAIPSTINSVDNSTFSSNLATGNGGAIAFSTQEGTHSIYIVNFSNNTLANNQAQGSGGGLSLPYFNSIQSFISNIVAENSALVSGPDVSDITGAITVELFNLIGNNSGSDFIAGMPNANHSYVGTALAPINPRLAPLANYGGITDTYALLPNSPAVNNGANPLSLLFDQRGVGFFRTSGPSTDIGAFELQEGCPIHPKCKGHRGNDEFRDAPGLCALPVGPSLPPLPAAPPPTLIPESILPKIEEAPRGNNLEEETPTMPQPIPRGEGGCSSINGSYKNGFDLIFMLLVFLLSKRMMFARNEKLLRWHFKK